jgi:hypothetical protein
MFTSPQIMDFIVQDDTAKFSSPQTPHGDANTLKHNSIYESTKYE